MSSDAFHPEDKATSSHPLAAKAESEPKKKGGAAPFLQKLYVIVNDPGNKQYVEWCNANGTAFVVHKAEELAAKVLPLHYKHSNFCSFLRQLNIYGFHKIDEKRLEFQHEKFRRGAPELMKEIARRKSVKREAAQDADGDDDEGARLHLHSHPHPPSYTAVRPVVASPVGSDAAPELTVNDLLMVVQSLRMEVDQLKAQQQRSDSLLVPLLADLRRRQQLLQERTGGAQQRDAAEPSINNGHATGSAQLLQNTEELLPLDQEEIEQMLNEMLLLDPQSSKPQQPPPPPPQQLPPPIEPGFQAAHQQLQSSGTSSPLTASLLLYGMPAAASAKGSPAGSATTSFSIVPSPKQ